MTIRIMKKTIFALGENPCAARVVNAMIANVVVNSLLAAFPEEVCFCEFLESWRTW